MEKSKAGNKLFFLISGVLVITIAFCFSMTVHSQGSQEKSFMKHEADAKEQAFLQETKEIISAYGCENGGITMTKVYEDDGSMDYTVLVHHKNIRYLDKEQGAAMQDEISLAASDMGTVCVELFYEEEID